MKTFSKDSIFAADDIKRVPFPVPEWGEDGGVYLIQLSGNGRMRIMEIYQSNKEAGAAKQTAALSDEMLLSCVADEKGAVLFEKADLPKLRQKNGVVLERIVKAALELNGMGTAEEGKAAKN